MSYNGADVIFPHLGIVIKTLKNHITLFGDFNVAFYGIIIGIGMLLALFVIVRDAKRHGNDPDLFYDFFIIAIITGVIGARVYYVIFQWDMYRDDLWSVFNIRRGGLAIYGGIIAGGIACVIFARRRKVKLYQISDSVMLGVLVGQILGRWGNFFNCEAFGGYTDSLFAMRMKLSLVNPSMVSEELMANAINDNGIIYIQAHPTFLYESAWNLLVFLFLYRYAAKHEPGSGNVTILYFLFYGIGRFFIEGMRTDQLKIPGTDLAVSQCLSLVLVVLSAVILIRRRLEKNGGVPAAG